MFYQIDTNFNSSTILIILQISKCTGTLNHPIDEPQNNICAGNRAASLRCRKPSLNCDDDDYHDSHWHCGRYIVQLDISWVYVYDSII